MQLFDSLSKTLKTIDKKELKIYACGVTVYDNIHIGHARLYLCLDVLLRLFDFKNIKYKYVRNITDVDDKIINKAIKENKSFKTVASKYTTQMQKDFNDLGLINPQSEPKATDSIDEIINFINKLISKNYAYKSSNGDILFDVSKFKNYGELSKRDLENQVTQLRVNSSKDNTSDFVLWKVDNIDEPTWDSPFGKGRPGWHIECSAMICKELGETIDIHAGGEDLKFPHHENEIAQSEACFNKSLSNVWMHVGHLNIKGEKMSKSLGNFIKVKDILTNYHKDIVRLSLLTAHYKKQQDFTIKQMHQADKLLFNIHRLSVKPNSDSHKLNTLESHYFLKALMNDLNTPIAIEQFHKIISKIEHEKNTNDALVMKNDLYLMANILGIKSDDNQKTSFFRFGLNSDEIIKIENLLNKREQARSDKNWILADEIRDKLCEMNVSVYDDTNKSWWSRTII